jgi:hypothetical protein
MTKASVVPTPEMVAALKQRWATQSRSTWLKQLTDDELTEIAAFAQEMVEQAEQRIVKSAREHQHRCEANARDMRALSGPEYYMARATAFEQIAVEIENG